jgi:MFS family permease
MRLDAGESPWYVLGVEREQRQPRQSRSEAGWLVLAASFVVTFCTWNAYTTFGVFISVLSQEFGWSRGAISLAFTMTMVIGGILGFVVGGIADRYGPRTLMVASAAFVGVSFLLASAMSALWHFYLLMGLATGLGMASTYLVPIATVSRWFVTRRGLAMGIMLSSLGVAYIVSAPLAAFLLRVVGWRTTYLVLGGSVCAIALPATGFIKNPPAQATAPAGGAQGGRDSQPRRVLAPQGLTPREAIGHRSFWILFLVWFLLAFAQMMIQVHVVPYATDLGLSLEHASLALTVYGFSTIAGRLIFGAAADRLGARLVFWLCVAVELAATTWLLARPSRWGLYVLMALFGLGANGADTAYLKVVGEIFGTRSIGTVFGILSLGWRGGAAAGPAVAGYLYDSTGLYTVAFGLATVGVLAGAGIFWKIKSPASGEGRNDPSR